MRSVRRPPPDTVRVATGEIDVAIALVAHGAARQISLCGLSGLERAAAHAAAEAKRSGVEFRLERDSGAGSSAIVGPRTRRATGVTGG
jgi:hypothetical protein